MSDFSEIKPMDRDSKIHLLEYFSNRRGAEDLSKEEAVVASKIFLERMKKPRFLPDELNPDNWQ